jgi:hypothetical protein
MKIRQVGGELFYAEGQTCGLTDGRTDGQTDRQTNNGRFSQFYERDQKLTFCPHCLRICFILLSQ